MTVYIGPKDRQLSSPIVHFGLNEPMGGPMTPNKRFFLKLGHLRVLEVSENGRPRKRMAVYFGGSVIERPL